MFFPPPPPAGTTVDGHPVAEHGNHRAPAGLGNQQPIVNDRNVDLPAIEVQALTDDLPNREARRRLAFNPGGPERGGDNVDPQRPRFARWAGAGCTLGSFQVVRHGQI